jgi:outer membrane protein
MKFARLVVILLVALSGTLPVQAQSSEKYGNLLTPSVRSGKLAGPANFADFVKDGKVSLSLQDAILLTLKNNSNIRVAETQIETQKFAVLSAHSPFDPLLQGIANFNRYSSPGYSQLQGVGQSSSATLNALSQTGQINYTQTFRTGTNVQVGISSNKSSSNSQFYYFNPYFNSSFNLQLSQPLLRNAGVFANTAALVVARRELAESRAAFEALVSDAILQVVNQYWSAVQARGNLEVSRESLKLAEISYNRDKRALELGALGPLDIYRSQSEMAARRVQVIQAEYAGAQAEDALRLTIGLNQDSQQRDLPLELTEQPEPSGELISANEEELLAKALSSRRELEAATAAVDIDHTNIRYAHNQLRPDLNLTGFYQSNGLGGNQYDLTTGQIIAPGGLGSSFGQLFAFGYPGYGGTLTLNWHIKNRAAQANLGTALAARTHDLYTVRQTQEAITREVNDAVHQLEEAKLAMDAGKTSMDLAQKSLAADQRKYELGAETNFFVLDSQSRVAESQLVLLQTQINYQLAKAALSHATGDVLESYHVQISELTK